MFAQTLLPDHLVPERYYALSRFLRERFGTRVQRVTIDAGFTCPNVDGTVAVGGCVYCDNRSFSPNRRQPRTPVRAQVERGMRILERRYGVQRFMAYFQAATNTYAPVDRLRRLYDEALVDARVVGLAIGTRPDCVPDEILDLIESYAPDRYVCLELGLQTVHDRTLDWMNRGHHFDAFVDAVKRCHGRGLDLCAHVILGLPGESGDDMLATADALAALPLHGVKIHNLHVVRDTPLAQQYATGRVHVLTRDQYVQIVCDFLEKLPPGMVIHRLSGDAPPDYLLAPEWCLDKPTLLRHIREELVRRDSWQGRRYRADATRSITAPDAGRQSLPLVRSQPAAYLPYQ
jgi:radical SAM protein (TIGR01212 family)